MKKKKRVYLAGPINGMSDSDANAWRTEVSSAADENEWVVVDPMARDYRGVEDMNVEEIVGGDLADIKSCDVVLANCWTPSYGTAMELVYAHQMGRRIVVVVPDMSRVSPWLRYHASAVTGSISAAMELIG